MFCDDIVDSIKDILWYQDYSDVEFSESEIDSSLIFIEANSKHSGRKSAHVSESLICRLFRDNPNSLKSYMYSIFNAGDQIFYGISTEYGEVDISYTSNPYTLTFNVIINNDGHHVGKSVPELENILTNSIYSFISNKIVNE
jgi:hypothetical protein